ncbi:MAG: 1-acylglycerol-3-phosphate O-acyltransferase [Deltaproteobacteria bacterium]|jgi:1-acyl-sn-glycerol-3-phosphate acyltransferase|nr:1-acylglycerol-3-phosphate O-acyltransferase [Deltaproteobacteria bacterium]
MIRTLYIAIWVVFATLVLGLTVMMVSLFVKSGNPIHRIARFWGRSILVVSRIKVTVDGLSSIDPRRPYIYMPNHQSNFDIPVLLGYLTVQFRWLAKMELFKIPIFGHAMRKAGYISIDRNNRESAFKSLELAAEKIRNGVSVLIFPEGTRSRDGRIQPFKKGGFVMAIESGVPIVPVIISGARAIMTKGKFRVNPGQIRLSIQKPIDTTIYSRDTKEALMERVRRVICDNFEPIDRGERPC